MRKTAEGVLLPIQRARSDGSSCASCTRFNAAIGPFDAVRASGRCGARGYMVFSDEWCELYGRDPETLMPADRSERGIDV